MPQNVTTLFSDRHNILECLRQADLVIGAVLIPGAKAPHLVRRDDLKMMQPRAVIIDVAIDQGGCVETSRPTTHAKPTYIVDDIVHYCVTNMPGAVGRTSTYALTNVTLPYALQLANKGPDRAIQENSALREGVNIKAGKVTNAAVAETFGLECVSVCELTRDAQTADGVACSSLRKEAADSHHMSSSSPRGAAFCSSTASRPGRCTARSRCARSSVASACTGSGSSPSSTANRS